MTRVVEARPIEEKAPAQAEGEGRVKCLAPWCWRACD